MSRPGSYANGFAPRDGQPLYPELWRGCLGAWAPCLGPTGLTLRDWSGFGNHAAFTTPAASTAWAVSGGRYSIRAAAGGASMPTGLVLSASQLAMSIWFRRSAANSFVSVGAYDNNDSRFGFDAFSDGNVYFEIANGGLTFGSIATNDANWHHFAAIYDGNGATNADRLKVYLDGVGKSVSFTGTIPASIAIASAFNLCSFSMRTTTGDIDDVRLYRSLSANQVTMLASRRGIAYEFAPRRRASVQVAAFNRRRRLLVGV